MKRMSVKQMESWHGKPLSEIVTSTYAEHKTIAASAEALGIADQTFSHWIMYSGLMLERRKLVPNPDSGFIWPSRKRNP